MIARVILLFNKSTIAVTLSTLCSTNTSTSNFYSNSII